MINKLFAIFIIFTFLNSYADDKKIKAGALPALSPDGKTLVFNWNGDIWKVPVSGGEAEQLTSHAAEDTAPVFSPDGKRIAFVSDREGSSQAYVMPADGGEPKRVGYHSEGYRTIDWYDDGKSLLVRSRRDNHGRDAYRFYRVYLNRQAEEEVFNAGVVRGDLSPGGKKVIFSREGAPLYRKGYKGSQSSQVWIYDEETEDYSQPVKGEFAYRSPMWGSDESYFFYVSNESGAFNIWKFEFESGKKTQLTDYKDDSVILPSVARSGKSIVYRHLFDFYVLDTESGDSKKVDVTVDRDIDFINKKASFSKSTSDADFSSDGLEVVFTASYDLWLMDTVLKEPVRLTETAEIERDVIFSKDNEYIYCVRDSGLKTQLIRIEKDEDKFWWQCRKFKESVIVESDKKISNLSESPDGKSLAYVRGNGDLYIFNLEASEEKLFKESWDTPYYDWSPDSKWIAYAIEDNNYNSDVWLAPVDGSREPYNVSFHPEWDGYPAFSADGSVLAFSSRRFDDEVDICYVYLTKDDSEGSARDRKLEEALAAMKKRKSSGNKKETPEKAASKTKDKKQEASDSEKSAETKKGDKATDKKPEEAEKAGEDKVEEKKKDKGITIDFEGLNERIESIKMPGTEYRLFWSEKGSKLGFLSSYGSKKQMMKVEFPDKLKPSPLYGADVTPIEWTATDSVYCLAKGVPAVISKGKLTAYQFSIAVDQNIKEINRQVFRHIWRKMRDWYYDESLNNLDWDKMLKKYEAAAASAPDSIIFDRVVYMLLGELNGSHLGYRSRGAGFTGAYNARQQTAHLGVKFDEDFKGPGLKIAKVIKGSPASFEKSLLKVGEIILEIDGLKCDIKQDLTVHLNGPLERDIFLKVDDAEGGSRDVVIRPLSYSAIRDLLYDEWIYDNRSKTHETSKGKVGYLHVAKMAWSEFRKFQEEVFREGHSRDGLIIDVRDNGGGFTADHLLTVLTQPEHAICLPRGGGRGYPFSRRVYSNWNKPVVVLCNQNSFSNAEIFSHAIKALKRGKLIGVPTAGGVISTGSADILGRGSIRIPFRGWYTALDGEDMELNGAVPDIILWPLPGELESGVDEQLNKALDVILQDVKEYNSREKVKLKKASDR